MTGSGDNAGPRSTGRPPNTDGKPASTRREPAGSSAAATRCLDFSVAVSKSLKIRDVRALAVLTAPSDDARRAVQNHPGLSTQHLAHVVQEPEETVRHLLRGLQMSGLVTRCGSVQRTHLFCATLDAKQKFDLCLAVLAGAADNVSPPHPGESGGVT